MYFAGTVGINLQAKYLSILYCGIRHICLSWFSLVLSAFLFPTKDSGEHLIILGNDEHVQMILHGLSSQH